MNKFLLMLGGFSLSACGEAETTPSDEFESESEINETAGLLVDAARYCTGGSLAASQPVDILSVDEENLPTLVQRFASKDNLYDPETAKIAKFEQDGAQVWVLREDANFECLAMLTSAEDRVALLEQLLAASVLAPTIDDPIFQQPFWALPLSFEDHAGNLAYAKLQGASVDEAKKNEVQLSMTVVRPDMVR